MLLQLSAELNSVLPFDARKLFTPQSNGLPPSECNLSSLNDDGDRHNNSNNTTNGNDDASVYLNGFTEPHTPTLTHT